MDNLNSFTIYGFMRNDLKLSGLELVVYAIIFCNTKKPNDVLSFSRFIGESIGVSQSTAIRILHNLEHKGLIKVSVQSTLERNHYLMYSINSEALKTIENSELAELCKRYNIQINKAAIESESEDNLEEIIDFLDNYDWSGQEQEDYVISDGTITTINKNIIKGVVEIPREYKGKRISKIGRLAFSFSEITSIKIPESIVSIGDYAFTDCSSLSQVILPNSLKEVGSQIFSNCSSLKEVNLPTGINPADGIFSGCSGLTKCVIPKETKTIEEYAFSYCKNLPSISLPKGIKEIKEAAFSECSSLTSIIIPEGVTSIESGAFSHCSNLSSVTIPTSVVYIGDYAFYHCSNLTSINIPLGIQIIKEGTFGFCTSLSSLTIPKSVTSIEGYAFCDCVRLSSMNIPSSVTSIAPDAFIGCKKPDLL